MELHGKPLTIERRIVTRSPGSSASSSASGSSSGRGIGVGVVASLSDKDHQRLETMEKKIAELLEQVKSLKKQGHGEKP